MAKRKTAQYGKPGTPGPEWRDRIKATIAMLGDLLYEYASIVPHGDPRPMVALYTWLRAYTAGMEGGIYNLLGTAQAMNLPEAERQDYMRLLGWAIWAREEVEKLGTGKAFKGKPPRGHRPR